MSLLDTETKRIVTRNPLPAKCGPTCALYDLKTHRCILSIEQKVVNSKCDYDYSVEDAKAIAGQPNVKDLLMVVFNDGTKLP